MITKIIFPLFACVLAISIGMAGCKKSDSSNGNSSTSDASAAAPPSSPLEKEAQAAAMAEFQRHWVKGADGWITARVSGSPSSPDHFLRQVREITVDTIDSDIVSDADRLNGVEWSGVVNYKSLACREAGDSGMPLDGLA